MEPRLSLRPKLRNNIELTVGGVVQKFSLSTKVRWVVSYHTRWQLIPIEVSMMDGDLFDKLENVARLLRKNKSEKPFGGIQVCACWKVPVIRSLIT